MNDREVLLAAAKKLYDLKLVAGTSGNLSLRSHDENGREIILITPSSIGYDVMTTEQLVAMSPDGTVLEPGKRPSSEWQMHLALFRAHPHINAVVHTHSPIATGFAVNHQTIPQILIEMGPFIGGDIPLAPFAPAGSAELAEIVTPYFSQRNACLMANHGVLCAGTSMDAAFLVAEYVEDAARIYYYAKTSGTPVVL